MVQIAKKHTDHLPDLKKMVEESYNYFKDNVDTYNDFMKFVFDTALTQEAIGALKATNKPTIEFNITESYISRLRGEFAKQMPSITVRAADGVPLSALTPTFIETMKVVEGYLRYIIYNACNDMTQYNVYSDLLAGGFSGMKVFTDYVNDMSMEQNIYLERLFNPTLSGYDTLARRSDKGDGRYCFEIYPMNEEAFIGEWGEELLKTMKFTKTVGNFSWSFKDGLEKIILVCELYEKKYRKERIVKLSNGYTVPERVYKKFLQEWEESGNIEQPPIPIGESRISKIEYIVRYRFCENAVLDYVETDFKHLPIFFADGNSVVLNGNNCSYQKTRPYVYHAKGAQMMKNMAGQSLCAELENTIQHKFIIPIESVPTESQYQLAYQNVQRADTLLYNHFLDTDSPNITLPPPREVVRTPIPPQYVETFQLADQLTQTVLGTYDQSLGRADLSGISVALQGIKSNSAAEPYLVGYIKALNRACEIIVDLIPKYYRTPRTLPTVSGSGKHDFVEINKAGGLYMNYDSNHLQIKVEAGVNYTMQKEISLQTVVKMAQAMPNFAQFFTQHGLQILLDNMDIRGIDELKEKAEEFEKQQQQMQQQAMQSQQQQQQVEQQMTQMQLAEGQKELESPTQGQLGAMAIQEKAKVDAANLQLKEQDQQQKFLELISKVQMQEVEAQVQQSKVEAENARSAIEAAVALSKHIGEQHVVSTE